MIQVAQKSCGGNLGTDLTNELFPTKMDPRRKPRPHTVVYYTLGPGRGGGGAAEKWSAGKINFGPCLVRKPQPAGSHLHSVPGRPPACNASNEKSFKTPSSPPPPLPCPPPPAPRPPSSLCSLDPPSPRHGLIQQG